MLGIVKAYSAAVNAGCIKGEDGEIYQFAKSEWSCKAPPSNSNVEVNFDPEGKRALRVIDVKGEKGE